MTHEALHTVFKSPLIAFDSQSVEDKLAGGIYRLVRAQKPIKSGSILLIEHCFTDLLDDPKLMKGMIRYNKQLCDSLYPRVVPWSAEAMLGKELPEAMNGVIFDKVRYNVFGFGNTVIIGNDISRFNHSMNPNAKVIRRTHILPSTEEIEEFSFSYLAVLATKDIDAGEEIFIKYNNNLNYGDSSPELIIEEIEAVDEKQPMVEVIIKQYMKKGTFAAIAAAQYAIYKGVYLTDEGITYTQRFADFISEKYKVAFDMKLVVSWLAFVRAQFSEVGFV